jgi:MFS family permease
LDFLRREKGLMIPLILGSSMLGLSSYATSSWAPAYFARSFGWGPARTGLSLAVVLGVFAVAGTIFWGGFVDRMYRRGMRDAHLRVHVLTSLAGTPFAVAAFLVRDPMLALGLLTIAYLVLLSYGGGIVSAVQVISPPLLRARLSAVTIFVGSLIGVGGGPLVVGAFSQYLFRDPSKLGWSLALTLGLAGPAAALFLNLARRRFGELATAAERPRQLI